VRTRRSSPPPETIASRVRSLTCHARGRLSPEAGLGPGDAPRPACPRDPSLSRQVVVTRLRQTCLSLLRALDVARRGRERKPHGLCRARAGRCARCAGRPGESALGGEEVVVVSTGRRTRRVHLVRGGGGGEEGSGVGAGWT
jgi:hypothetical protein